MIIAKHGDDLALIKFPTKPIYSRVVIAPIFKQTSCNDYSKLEGTGQLALIPTRRSNTFIGFHLLYRVGKYRLKWHQFLPLPLFLILIDVITLRKISCANR